MKFTCQALDMNGRRCNKLPVRTVGYHGDHQIYGSWTSNKEPTWVRVHLCNKHSSPKVRKRVGEEK